MKRTVLLLFIALFVAIAGPLSAGERAVERQHCSVNAGPCVAKTTDGAIEVTLDITPKPVAAMRELTFQVQLKDRRGPMTDASVKILLSMPGMYMGKNEVTLSSRNGRYEGTGIIVRCPSGKKTWQADVVIRSSDKIDSTGFIFEVQ